MKNVTVRARDGRFAMFLDSQYLENEGVLRVYRGDANKVLREIAVFADGAWSDAWVEDTDEKAPNDLAECLGVCNRIVNFPRYASQVGRTLFICEKAPSGLYEPIKVSP